MTDAIHSVQTPAQRGRFSLCALILVLVLLGCDSLSGVWPLSCRHSNETDGHQPGGSYSIGEASGSLVRELFGFSAGKLAFDLRRMTHVIHFVNGKAVHKTAGKEKK